MSPTRAETHRIANLMRQILREQFTNCTMPQHLVRHIFDEGLLAVNRWPATHVVLTERGREFLAEADADGRRQMEALEADCESDA